MKNIETLFNYLKNLRGFDAKDILAKKLEAINNFFTEEKLDSCVLGISGGIDSALVLYLLAEASQLPNSPIKRIHAMTMPIYGDGTTNQREATNKGLEVILEAIKKYKGYKITYSDIDLTEAYKAYRLSQDAFTTPFADGQLASIVRTPMLYYKAAILQEEGFKSIVVGTTNLSEGGYIGFYGKASDGMNDLQPISDLFKSEVYALATLLGVPEKIIIAIPAGDVYDGKTDEEMIGAPYWFLEFYMLYIMAKQLDSLTVMSNISKMFNLFDGEEISTWSTYSTAIQLIRQKNEHKYKVGLPSRHVNVLSNTFY